MSPLRMSFAAASNFFSRSSSPTASAAAASCAGRGGGERGRSAVSPLDGAAPAHPPLRLTATEEPGGAQQG